MQIQKLSFKFIVALICINLTIPPTMLFADPANLGTDTSLQPEVSADETTTDSAAETPSDPWEDGAISEATPSLDEVVQIVINEHFPHGMISVQREKGTTANGNEYDFTVFDHQNYGSASHFKADGTMSEFEPSEEHLIEMQRQADESAMQSTESENSANTEEAEAPGSEENSPAEETTDTSDPFSAETDDRPLSEMDEEEKQEMYGPFLEALEESEQAWNEANQEIEDAASQNDGNDSSVPAAEDTASTEAVMPETPGTEVMPTEEPAADMAQEEFNEEEFLNNWDMENPEEEFIDEEYPGYSGGDWEEEYYEDDYSEEDYSDYSEDTTMYGSMDYQNYSDPMSTGTDGSGSESTGQVPAENYAADRTDPTKDAKYDPKEAKERREKRKLEKEAEKKAKEEADRKWWEEAREKQKRDAAEREAAKQRALAEARARAAAAAQNGGAR